MLYDELCEYVSVRDQFVPVNGSNSKNVDMNLSQISGQTHEDTKFNPENIGTNLNQSHGQTHDGTINCKISGEGDHHSKGNIDIPPESWVVVDNLCTEVPPVTPVGSSSAKEVDFDNT